MRSVLFCILLKTGTLEKYLAFAKETTQKPKEYSEMLKRYDIHCAKIWNSSLNGKDYVFVYHEVGSSFEEKMKGWDTSTHPLILLHENFQFRGVRLKAFILLVGRVGIEPTTY